MPNRERFGHAWDQLGRRNALGAILTVDGKVADWELGEFMATGRLDAARFLQDLERLSPGTPRARLLDFGCGVGRVARAFAPYFEEVVGVDVAPSMIKRARSLHADCDRCTFVLNRAPNLKVFESNSFSVVYTRLVLQHIRPATVKGYIGELIRVLQPGGVLMFQLAEVMNERGRFEQAPVTGNLLKRSLPGPIVIAWRRVKYAFLTSLSGPQIEVFGVDRPVVEALISAASGRLLEAKPDNSHGPEGRGYEYWVTRP